MIQSWARSQLEFFAEHEEVRIVPNFSMPDGGHLIGIGVRQRCCWFMLFLVPRVVACALRVLVTALQWRLVLSV
jgi:hypothetical protein